MPQATPEVTIEIAAIGWDILVTVRIKSPYETRLAAKDEAEVMINDIGEMPLDYTVYHQAGWRGTDEKGQVLFTYDQYPWLEGYNGIAGANRLHVIARLMWQAETAVVKEMRIGTETWTDPPAAFEGSMGFPSESEW